MKPKTDKLPPYKQVLVSDLTPYAKNSRTHTDAQIAQVAASIKEFGFTNPVLIRANGDIIAGHCRVLAAQSLGMTQVPCIELGHLTATQARAYVIADNKLALEAGWDHDVLKIEIEELSAEGFDLCLTGFSEKELDSILGNVETKDEGSEIGDELTYRVVVECDNEQHQGRLLERLESEGLKCQPLIS